MLDENFFLILHVAHIIPVSLSRTSQIDNFFIELQQLTVLSKFLATKTA